MLGSISFVISFDFRVWCAFGVRQKFNLHSADRQKANGKAKRSSSIKIQKYSKTKMVKTFYFCFFRSYQFSFLCCFFFFFLSAFRSMVDVSFYRLQLPLPLLSLVLLLLSITFNWCRHSFHFLFH